MEPLQTVGVISSKTSYTTKNESQQPQQPQQQQQQRQSPERHQHPQYPLPQFYSSGENVSSNFSYERGLSKSESRRNRPKNNPPLRDRVTLPPRHLIEDPGSNRHSSSESKSRVPTTGLRKSESFPSPLISVKQQSRHLSPEAQRRQQQQQQLSFRANVSSPTSQHCSVAASQQQQQQQQHHHHSRSLTPRSQRRALPPGKSIPSHSKIMTTFTVGDEEEDEGKENIGLVGRQSDDQTSQVTRNVVYRSKTGPQQIPFDSTGIKSARTSGCGRKEDQHREEDLNKGVEEDSVSKDSRRYDPKDDVDNVKYLEFNGIVSAANNFLSKGDENSGFASRSPSLLEVRIETRSNFTDADDSDGIKRREPKYDRFDTGFWEDESSFGADVGNISSKLKTMKEGKMIHELSI